jgi:DNA-directed RNA polymerase specialized sigma24 family protein
METPVPFHLRHLIHAYLGFRAVRRCSDSPVCSAEDILHDAVLDILVRTPPDVLGSLDPRETERWLARAIRSMRIAAYMSPHADVGPIPEGAPSTSPGPVAILCAAEALGVLERAIAALPPSQRRAFDLHTRQGLGLRATMERMGLPSPDAVWHCHARALRALRLAVAHMRPGMARSFAL